MSTDDILDTLEKRFEHYDNIIEDLQKDNKILQNLNKELIEDSKSLKNQLVEEICYAKMKDATATTFMNQVKKLQEENARLNGVIDKVKEYFVAMPFCASDFWNKF